MTLVASFANAEAALAALSPADVVRAANDALNRGAVERLAGLLADDMLFEDRASPVDLPPSVRGGEAVMGLLGSYRGWAAWKLRSPR